MSARRYTSSMTTISIPVTTQQSAKPFVIQVESEDDVFSSIHETVHIDEQTSTVNDLVMPCAKEITNPNKFDIGPSFIDAPQPVQDYDKPSFSQSDDSFHDQDDETLQQVLDRIYEDKIE